MKRTSHFIRLVRGALAFGAAVAAIQSAHATNLLTNPGFEQPQLNTPGNNFPATLPGWTLHTNTVPCENGHNVVRGGAVYDGGPDNAVEGAQYYDICGASGYLSQSFTLSSYADISFGASFSRRDASSGGGNVEIYDATNTTRLEATAGVSVSSWQSQEIWMQAIGGASLPAGTYVVRVNLEDAANVDAVFVTPSFYLVVGNGTPASVNQAALDQVLFQSVTLIAFNSGGAAVTIPITGTKNITQNVSILGNNRITLYGRDCSRIFSVAPGFTLQLQDLTLDSGGVDNPMDGGAILNQGSVVLRNVHITRSRSTHGGAIQNSGVLTASNSLFDYNLAAVNGGAIDNTGVLVMRNCTVANNTAGFRGGGVYNYLGDCQILDSRLQWNTAGAYGGGAAADGGTMSLSGGRIRGNRAGSNGGGGLSLNGKAGVGSVEFSLNTASGPGGGIYVADGGITLAGLRIFNCSGSLGGGLAVHGGTTDVQQSIIQYNRNTIAAPEINHGGGGIYVEGGNVTVGASRISRNQSNYAGGGVMVNSPQGITLTNCVIAGNSAVFGQVGSQNGALALASCTVSGGTGGIWSDGGTVDLKASTISGNSDSGITLQRGAAATLVNSTISGNTALQGGGLLLDSGARAMLTNVTVFENSASEGGNLYLARPGNVFLTLTNSIVANPAFGDNCAGKTVTASRFSISSDDQCGLTGPGDMEGTDPLLGPLQNNGGITLTHMPLPGSPAIDGVSGTQAPADDQRGFLRPAVSGYDIGAVEADATGQDIYSPPPATTFDGNDTADEDGDGSTDAQEILSHTNPASAADVFRLSISPANPLQLEFPTKTGLFYRLYVTPDNAPAPLSQWINAGQPTITGDAGIRSFTIVRTPGIARRFYRVHAMATDGPWP